MTIDKLAGMAAIVTKNLPRFGFGNLATLSPLQRRVRVRVKVRIRVRVKVMVRVRVRVCYGGPSLWRPPLWRTGIFNGR